MSSAYARSLALLSVLQIAAPLGCVGDPADDDPDGLAGGAGGAGGAEETCAGTATGAGGTGAGEVGAGGAGGEAPATCECSLASQGCGSSLPVISMAHLVLQSQVEPFRGDQAGLPGDFAVEQVQAALVDEGIDVGVDGWFGNETAAGYSSWQESLGYSGLDANGIPGPTSLAALGVDRFEIDDKIVVGAKTTYTGLTVNQRTRDMLVEADAMVAHSIVLSQGSYNPGGVGASAGTHDGGGAIDVSVSNLSETQRWQTIKALRTVGFAAWLRTPSQGDWPYHIHAIAIGDTDVSTGARDQVADYYVGKNGLASHAGDNTPAAYQVPFTWWEKYQSN
jgi:hypothetical protein